MNTDKVRIPEPSTDGVGRVNKVAYRDGYIHGREQEHHIQEDKRVIRDNNSAASGLLFGMTLAAIASVLGGVIFFATHQNQPSNTAVPTAPSTVTQP
ncbi:MAG: hypothetical protein M3O33_15465 [Cyanobacteriota bacterium]|nr:hypothetical protein [Cyanobacteriota bacterium]